MRSKIVLLAGLLVLLVVSCQFSGNKKEAVKGQDEIVLKADDSGIGNGKEMYKKHCKACHQPNGKGIPHMYPGLFDNDVVSGEKEALINIVLHGLKGEIIVNGDVFNGVMASYRNLSDEEIASILNYLRSDKFENSGDRIMPDDVSDLRN